MVIKSFMIFMNTITYIFTVHRSKLFWNKNVFEIKGNIGQRLDKSYSV